MLVRKSLQRDQSNWDFWRLALVLQKRYQPYYERREFHRLTWCVREHNPLKAWHWRVWIFADCEDTWNLCEWYLGSWGYLKQLWKLNEQLMCVSQQLERCEKSDFPSLHCAFRPHSKWKFCRYGWGVSLSEKIWIPDFLDKNPSQLLREWSPWWFLLSSRTKWRLRIPNEVLRSVLRNTFESFLQHWRLMNLKTYDLYGLNLRADMNPFWLMIRLAKQRICSISTSVLS